MRFQSMALSAVLVSILSIVLGASAATAEWFDENKVQGYDYVGPYAQFGISIGRIDYDNIGVFNVDSGASGGFTLAGGYRALPWLAAEAHFTFLGGKDNVEIGNVDGDAEIFAFTFGPKLYPLGFFDVPAVPHTVQPYAFIGIGGGEGEVEFDGGGDVSDGSFIARFILGIDFWATDNVGFFVEGGGLAVEEDAIDGVGVFTFGAQYRF